MRKVFWGLKTETATLSLWSLVWPKDVNVLPTNIMLVRDPITDAVTRDTLQEVVAKKIPRPVDRQKSAAGREEKQRFLKEWPCKHIFT